MTASRRFAVRHCAGRSRISASLRLASICSRRLLGRVHARQLLVHLHAVETSARICRPVIGALPGAMPPLIGYAASHGSLTPEAWTLFAILFIWQSPHFSGDCMDVPGRLRRAGIPSCCRWSSRMGCPPGRQISFCSLDTDSGKPVPVYRDVRKGVSRRRADTSGGWFPYTGCAGGVRSYNVRGGGCWLASIIYLPVIYGLMIFDRPSL